MQFGAAQLAIVLLASQAQAEPQFGADIPNSDSASRCIHCHTKNDGADKNNVTGFGTDWFQNSSRWTKALADFDSDSDGESNGTELGDPCGEWTKGSSPLLATFSNPNDSKSVSGNPDCATAQGKDDNNVTTAGNAGTWILVNPAGSANAWQSLSPLEQIVTGRNSDMVGLGAGWYWATDNTYFFTDLYPYIYK